MNNYRQSKFIIFYYLALFLLMVLMGSASAPSMAVRLLFLAFFILPLFKFKYLMPPVIMCTVTLLSVTDKVLYLPLPYTEYYYYFIIILILLLQSAKKLSVRRLIPFVLFWLFIVFVDFVLGSQSPGMKKYYPMLLLLGLSCSGFYDERESIPLLINTFCLISLLSSLLFLINYQTFIVQYNSIGLERSGWTDPNYFSCILGMGAVSALIQLMRRESVNALVRLFWIATFIVSVVSQVLLASRGGILAVTVASLVALLFVKIKTKYKLFIFILAIVLVFFMYNNGYFELLEYRIQEDSGGSARLEIWSKKLDSFFNSDNFFDWIFGYGYDGGLRLGYGHPVGVHNDYVAMTVEYGFIGLGFLLWSFIRPYKEAAAKYKSLILSLVVYLAAVCLTLEPLTQGNFAYMSFYLVICFISGRNSSGQFEKIHK